MMHGRIAHNSSAMQITWCFANYITNSRKFFKHNEESGEIKVVGLFIQDFSDIQVT